MWPITNFTNYIEYIKIYSAVCLYDFCAMHEFSVPLYLEETKKYTINKLYNFLRTQQMKILK